MSKIEATETGQLDFLKKSRLQSLIKDEVTLNRIIEAGVHLMKNKSLLECDPDSILGSLYKAATLGFRLEPEFGECYLIPRNQKVTDAQGRESWKKVCTFQIGYRGWKSKCLESGHIYSLESREVCENDKFEFRYGSSNELTHIAAKTDRGKEVAFYALARLKSGVVLFEVINRDEAEKSRRFSESQYDTIAKEKVFSVKPKDIWLKNYAAMALRRPIKRLCASLPLSPAIEAAMKADNSITYIQKDGSVVTISQKEVEQNAEPLPEQKENIDAEKQESYMEIKQYLADMDNADAVIMYFKDYSQTVGGKIEVFAELFFERVAMVAVSIEELNKFYLAATAWHQTPRLVKIISQKKKALQDAKN